MKLTDIARALFSDDPLTESAPAESERRLAALDVDLSSQALIASQRQEIDRLEGILDAAPDPDSNLTGSQSHSLYRELTAATTKESSRDLTQMQRDRLIGLSHAVYATRGDGENLLETHVDFILGDEFIPSVKGKGPAADKLQKELDEIWNDPRNRIRSKHEDWTLSNLLEGELILGADLNEHDGSLELGWVDPMRVECVQQDHRRRDGFLHVSSSTPGKPHLWFVLDSFTEDIQIQVLEPNEEGFKYRISQTVLDAGGENEAAPTTEKLVHGLCFFWPWIRPEGATRGRGELASVIDHIDFHDELLTSAVETASLRRWFVMHIKDPSIRTAAQANAKLKELGLLKPPRNPKVLATNKNVEVEVTTHQGSGGEDAWLDGALGTSIYGAKGFPESWRGSLSNANLGAARAADTVPLRRLRRKQRRVRRRYHRLLEVSLILRSRASGVKYDAAECFELIAMEVGGKDKQRGAEIVSKLASAMVQMSSIECAKPELLNDVFIQCLRDSGIEVKKELEGVPEHTAADKAGEVAATVRQLMSRKGTDPDDPEGEFDLRGTGRASGG